MIMTVMFKHLPFEQPANLQPKNQTATHIEPLRFKTGKKVNFGFRLIFMFKY